MVYANWDVCSIATYSPKLKWYPVDSVVEYLNQVRPYIINGHQQETSIPILQWVQIPASKTKRFQGYFINEGVGDWGLKLDELSLNLAKLSFCYTNRNVRPYTAATTTTEIKILGAIHDMRQAIERKSDIFDQSVFEDRYGLIWKETRTTPEEEEHDALKCPNAFCRLYKNAVGLALYFFGRAADNKIK